MARPNNAAAIAGYIQGLREAKAAFQALPQIARDRTNETNEMTARMVVSRAKARLASSPSIRTRSLYNSVVYTVNKNNGRAKAGITSGSTTIASSMMGNVGRSTMKVKGILIAGKGGSALRSLGAKFIRPTRYAHLVEYGSHHMSAEPFMNPAVEAEKQPHIDRSARAGKAIEQDIAAIGLRNL